MITVSFSKYHGTGNDFIMIDNRSGGVTLSREQVAFLCHRRFGIGADGLILLERSEKENFKMVYFNSDGLTSSMCGNGGRCITAFATANGIEGDTFTFSAIDGLHESKIMSRSGNNFFVSLKMKNVDGYGDDNGGIFMDTGSPHFILFKDHLRDLDINTEGRKIRNSERFKKEGVNVNFVEVSGNTFHVRTYERGVEAETWSCGTGAVAVALALDIKEMVHGNSSVELNTPGGKLEVSYKKNNGSYSDIWLSGPVVKVFDGTIELE